MKTLSFDNEITKLDLISMETFNLEAEEIES